MSDYDEYFDSIDEDALTEFNALDAMQDVGQTSNKPPVASTSKSTKSVSTGAKTPASDSDSAFFDLTLDVDDMEELEERAAQQLNGQPSSSKQGGAVRTLSTSRQTDLYGRILPPPSPTKQVQHRPVFGQKMKKTKVWDQTAFAKTGWRNTKPSKSKKGKGKSTTGAEEDEDEECVDLDAIPAPFMPRPYDGLPSYPQHKLTFLQIKKMKLQADRLSTREWIFPLNNPKRDYQYNIVRHSLFENCLVAIPTGVGKTFIAGCVMLNYYRWFPQGKIIFVAPTKPLVAQQIEACHQSCGIPGTDAIELTGQIPRTTRAIHWQTKRVFYMTPQTLVNDLATGTCDPNKVALLVIDEAHKGTGDYAYAQIVRFMMATNPFFRILALTATPGSKPEAVQAIVDSLHISHIEIRNEGSMDVQPYMHKRTTTQHVIDIAGELLKIQAPLTKLMNSMLAPLRSAGILWYTDALQVKDFMCTTKVRDLTPTQKWAYTTLLNLGALARILGYFMEFSVGMAYTALLELGTNAKKGAKKGPEKPPTQSKISKDPNYTATVQEIERQRNVKGSFPTHPKMEKLRMLAIQHFAGVELDEEEKAQPGSKPAVSNTKMIVFCTYRDCVDEIVDMLKEQEPMIRAHRFIGQGTDKRGGKGVTQRAQIGVIKDFKEGRYNVIVSTSIGEEGLDIGEVDIIVCYDSQKAAIRMVQRVGRTGRKKDGKVEVLLAKGREEGNWASALSSYKDVQQSIVRGTDLELYGDVERLLPEEFQPQCIEMVMEIIPYEREERKRSASGPKSRLMPSKLGGGKGKATKKRNREPEHEEEVEEGSPSKKKQRKFVDSDSDSDSDGGPKLKKRTSTVKRTRSASNSISKQSKSRPAVLGGFVSARAMTMGLTDSDDELDPETELAKARTETESSRPLLRVPPPKKGEPSSDKSKAGNGPRSMAWLLGSDSEPEVKDSPLKHKGPDHIIDVGDSENSDVEILGEVKPKQAGLVMTTHHKDRAKSSPSGSFPILPVQRRNVASITPSPLDDPQDLSSPVLRRLKRGNGANDRVLMPPPPPLASSSRHENMARPASPMAPPRRVDSARLVKRSILDRNEFLEIEATHSGDEVDAGSSDSEGVANSSDQEFVTDTSGTQAPPDYDQHAIYRQGLFTQAPMGGAPRFASGPVRTGFLGRGRLAANAENVAVSSSPSRDDDFDRYSYGSFVVEDDDDILAESSSQPEV